MTTVKISDEAAADAYAAYIDALKQAAKPAVTVSARDILLEVAGILEQREATYGSFATVATTSQLIKRGGTPVESAVLAEANEMLAAKVARLLRSPAVHEDNYIDIIGYAALALVELRGG